MIWTDFLRGLAMIAGGLVLAALPGTGLGNGSNSGAAGGAEFGAGLVVLLPLVFVLGTLQSFFIPGVVLLCVDVERQLAAKGRLVRVLGLRNAGTHGATLAGNAIGGSLYLLLGLPALLVYSGLGFILSAFSEIFLQESPRVGAGYGPLPPRLGTDPKAKPPVTFLAELRVVISTPPVDLHLLVQVLIPLLTMLLPSFINQILGLPAQTLGLVFALLLAGSISAGLSSGLRGRSSHPYLPGLMAGLLLAALALPGKSLPWPLGATLLIGLGYCLGSLYLNSIEAVQTASMPGRGGRGHGMLESLSSILTPASYFIGAAVLGSGTLGVGSISASLLVAGLAGLLVVYSVVAALVHPIPRS
jgi:MFS transporter, DHA3 family, macrolide efflux protein